MIYLPLIFHMIFQASLAFTSNGECANTSTVRFLVQAFQARHLHMDKVVPRSWAEIVQK